MLPHTFVSHFVIGQRLHPWCDGAVYAHSSMDERGRVRPLVGLSKYSDFSDQYSNIDGLNASQLRGRLGIQGHIRNNTYVYADARYQRSFKGNKEGAQFNVGIKASF